MKAIHINQLGYRLDEPKKAIIPQNEADFSIIRVSDEKTVFTGKASEPVADSASGDTVRVADFSAFTDTGEYYILAGEEKSFPFKICENPYSGCRAAVLEMFNYQKCGVDLEAGHWSHPACHAAPATIYGTNKTMDVTGGWHDAGDYGRYIVPAAKAVADLLLAHELSPNPDSNLLEIVWFEIEWMLKMQDAQTGGVYHKVSCYKFNALNEWPHDEKDPLVLAPVSSTATADFAASMALASRFYPEKKDILLNAALRAYDWLCANPEMVFENIAGIHTGGYGDDNDKDERFWAACELFCAAQDTDKSDALHEYIKKEINAEHVYSTHPWFPKDRKFLSGLGWNSMGTYSIAAYLLHAGKKADNAVAEKMKNALFADCEEIMQKYLKCPYGISPGEFFPWGSNMVVANNAMMLLLASRFLTDDAKKAEYTAAAREHFHYLLGKNPLSQSYISGFGSNSMKNPHHRLSVAADKTVPGMVAGGPVARFDRDPAINEHCPDAKPMKRYIDDKESFSSNEITIYWNSPVYFVMAALGM